MTAAYEADGRPVDRATFYTLACDPRRSVVVEACAGAGKTWMLVSRILRALLDGAQPHEILAITFTRKAAGEMRERLGEWLREFAAPRTTDAQRAEALVQRGVAPTRAAELAPALALLHEQVLGGGRPVEIRTFHAWFSQLLRAAPLELLTELGMQPDMELIEELEDHRPDVYRRFHAAVQRDAALSADHATLIEQRGRSQARKWLDAAWDKRVELELADAAGVLAASVPPPAPLADDDGSHPATPLLTTEWRERLRELARQLGQGGVKAREAASGLEMALAEPDIDGLFDRAWRALFTENDTPRKQLGKVAALAGAQEDLARIQERVRQHHASLEHGRMTRLARVLLAEYAAYKQARGLADMSDLERCALALLRDATLSGWVQERLDAKVRHVLIDEFQDTSPLQWHALHAWLSAYAGAGGGASGQRPPGLFIVGDPKQSIYRFRRAEPRVFEAARGFVVEALGGTRLACDHTRRNAPEVLAALNGVFEAASAAGEFEGFRPHTTELPSTLGAGLRALPREPLPPKLDPAAAALAQLVWRDTLTTPRHAPDEVRREREAARVAAAIAELVDSGVAGPADVMVLCRKRESLRLAADALRALHLPYAAVEDHALMQAREARDLVALLDALVSPRHALSLAQALRSPLFSVGDDDLVALAQAAGERGDWWAALRRARDDPSPALRRAERLLTGWRAAATRLPPHDLLDRIVGEGELRERVAATVPPEQRAAALDAVDAVLGLALTLDGARYATPYNFVRALKRRLINVVAPARADAVRLLTVHGAKGLEAEVVFVMDADPEPKNTETTTLLVDWPVSASAPVCCAFVYSEGACPPSLVNLLDTELAARRREELNGLYVAMSRAKARLVFSATEPRRRAPGSSWWMRAEPFASGWVPEAGGAARVGAAGPVVLRVLPAWAPMAGAARGDAAAVPTSVAAPVDATPTGVQLGFDFGLESPAPPLAAPRKPRGKPPTVPALLPDPNAADTPATRLGKAVHRVLEWSTAGGAPPELAPLAAAAAREFGVADTEVARIARRILHSPTCARFFGGPGLHWAANEVPIGDSDDVLRIDRLAALDEPGAPRTWWVLDYKLQHAPELSPAYRQQMRRYRDAVRRLQPGEPVRCAFVTGEGAVIEVDTD